MDCNTCARFDRDAAGIHCTGCLLIENWHKDPNDECDDYIPMPPICSERGFSRVVEV